LSVVSQGRILAGIGLGWMKEEFDALNEPFDHLGARTDEYVAIMRKLWRATGPVGYEGRFYSFRPVRFKPQPIDKGMPLWVGGHSEAALARTAKYGAGWFAVELEPDEVRASVRRLGELARQAGREEPIEIACGTRLPLSGHNVDAAIQRVRDYQEAGVDHLILYFTTKRSASENLERMKRVADEVVPAIAR
jgi:alkanesulfonate monooxygenase SsuD/methylene tetrahydromethanopterin reductase-like flavin-dependent oxidoreductase (luciferase family)